jgi:hypothetical protein
MSQIIKALVLAGQYKGETVRVSNVSVDGQGRKKAACSLANGTRANIFVTDLEIIPPEPPTPSRPGAKASMPFVSGSTGSRSLNQTRSLVRARPKCELCGEPYNVDERKGQEGKLSVCSNCAPELARNSQEG